MFTDIGLDGAVQVDIIKPVLTAPMVSALEATM